MGQTQSESTEQPASGDDALVSSLTDPPSSSGGNPTENAATVRTEDASDHAVVEENVAGAEDTEMPQQAEETSSSVPEPTSAPASDQATHQDYVEPMETETSSGPVGGRGLVRENSLPVSFLMEDDRPPPPRHPRHPSSGSVRVPPAYLSMDLPMAELQHSVSCDVSHPILSMADANHLHASWSNINSEDFLGPSVAGFTARGYESASLLTMERPLPVSRVGSNQSNGAEKSKNLVPSVIHDAARITNWQTVLELCQSNPEAARYVGRDNWTALHHACNRRCPYPDVVEALIRAYPDALLLEEDKGWLPLHYACRFKCSKNVVRLLLHMYPDRGLVAVSKLDRQGRTPLYYAVRYDAPPGVVGLLLDVDASAVLSEDQNADSPLALVWDQWAEKLDGKRTLQRILLNDNDAAQMTKEERAKVVQKRLASQSKVTERWNKVNIFLKAAFGFSVDEESPAANENIGEEKKESTKRSKERRWRILHATSAIKCHPSLFLLASALHPEQALELDNQDLEVADPEEHLRASNLTALHLAAASPAYGEPARIVISELISLSPEATQTVDSCGSLPLHVISGVQHKTNWATDGANYIYSAYPHAVQTPDLEGKLPLHHAACNIIYDQDMNETFMERSVLCNLLDAYADGAARADNLGCLPLHYIASHGKSWDQQVDMLNSAHPAAARTRAGTKLFNRLPLHMAAANPNADTSLIKSLVDVHPAGASQADRQGKLPLHLACESGLAWESVNAIFESFPDAIRQPERNARGWTALHMAAACPDADLELLTKIVEHCPENAGIADSQGRYPLHLASLVGKNWEDGLSILFSAYPDSIRTPDNVGLLPFYIVSFRYSMPADEFDQPADETISRRYSQSVSIEALKRATAKGAEDATRVGNLFDLLKADPTVLYA